MKLYLYYFIFFFGEIKSTEFIVYKIYRI